MSTLVSSALPPVPMPVRFFFTHNGAVVQNFKVELTVGSETITRYTNENGGIGADVGEGSADFQNADPYADTLTLTCGFSVCNKNYIIRNMDLPYREDFILTESPPTSCSPCSCGGGSSSCYYTQEKCSSLYPCEDTVCRICPSCPTCPSSDCPICNVCSTCEVCKECEAQTCPVCPEPSVLTGVLIAIVTFLAGGGAVYLKFGLKTRIKIVKVNGIDKVYHQHEIVSGFHNPDTTHRTQPHLKGELLPKYEKDISGSWIYLHE